MAIVLTEKQQEGLNIAIERFNKKQRNVIISGYAGVGKSELVKFIIKNLQVEEHDVCYAAYTGKAAQVLRNKGNKNVSTLHKLLYKSRQRPDGTFFRFPVGHLPYKVLVVDECSMVPVEMIQLINKFNNLFTIYLGDPFQLPPVDKESTNDLLAFPHVFLDEVMRQAQDSEIIQISMKIRNGEAIAPFKGKDVQIIRKKDLSTGMLTWANQILVATNKKRLEINNDVRTLAGRGPDPEDGDKIICLRNFWEQFSDDGDPLINGTIGYLQILKENVGRIPYVVPEKFDQIVCHMQTEESGNFLNLLVDKKCIKTGDTIFTPQTEYKIGKRKLQDLIPKPFAYGYAITVHKAQGSEWENVLVIEERFPFDSIEHRRWLYTAVTRASKKLVLVLKN